MKLFFVLYLLSAALYAKTIRFSPLPMDKASVLFEQYNNMLKYLEKETDYKFEFVYSSSYQDLITKFKNGKIDIIEIGPLPYVKLKEQFNDVEPFLTFNSKKGKPFYRCFIVTKDPKLDSLENIKDPTIMLTSKLSTCGYLMSEFMFRKKRKSLENFNYRYVGTHTNVLLNILLEQNSIGTVKSTVLNKYEHFNFTKLIYSPAIPGFAFVANKKNIDNKQIKDIQNAILKLSPLTNKKDKKIVEKWSSNTKYGAIKTDLEIYEVVTEAIKNIDLSKGKSK
jgi:phosphonate transport system substrate-binding protein